MHKMHIANFTLYAIVIVHIRSYYYEAQVNKLHQLSGEPIVLWVRWLSGFVPGEAHLGLP